MTDRARLFERVGARAEQQSADLPPGVGEQEIAQAESVLGFTLPPVLNGLYRHVASSGVGPEYHLLPLTGNGRTAAAEYGALRAASGACWHRGVLPILDWGCGWQCERCSSAEWLQSGQQIGGFVGPHRSGRAPAAVGDFDDHMLDGGWRMATSVPRLLGVRQVP